MNYSKYMVVILIVAIVGVVVWICTPQNSSNKFMVNIYLNLFDYLLKLTLIIFNIISFPFRLIRFIDYVFLRTLVTLGLPILNKFARKSRDMFRLILSPGSCVLFEPYCMLYGLVPWGEDEDREDLLDD